jgi:acetyltransferase
MTMLEKTSPDDTYARFFQSLHPMPRPFAARLTQVDYDREMAFVALSAGQTPAADNNEGEMLGIAHLVMTPDKDSGEVAIIVRTDKQALGIGSALMDRIVRYGDSLEVGELYGDVRSENHTMIALCHRFGFSSEPYAGDAGTVRIRRRHPAKANIGQP